LGTTANHRRFRIHREIDWMKNHPPELPKGKLTLTITDNPALRKDILHFLDALKEAA
jgi:hypothetical protein